MPLGDAAASPPTSVSTTTWNECVGPARWLNEPLQRILSYPHPLPVQQAVIPTITRALMSGVPSDVSLTAPTGSGKTLCYLVPLLRLLTEAKKGIDDNALRCLILVPTQSLGNQVHRELQRLTRPTSIRVVCICTEASPEENAAEKNVAEADLLVRRVVLPRKQTFASSSVESWSCTGSSLLNTERGENNDEANDVESTGGDDIDFNDSDNDGEDFGETNSGGQSRDARNRDQVKVRYFSNADVIVATPQRLLHHLDHTRGLRLVDLRLLVIDEADQVLVGNFASQVQKVNARYEYEIQQQQQQQQRKHQHIFEVLAARLTANHTTSAHDTQSLSSLSSSSLLHLHGRNSSVGVSSLHKVLCSATLSSRIARISQVKLRNCSYYVLDSNGKERREEAAVVAAQDKESNTAALTVRTQFALPPTLQEHIVFVEDTYRPAVLLKLVHALRERIAAVQAQSRARAVQLAATEGAIDPEDDDRDQMNEDENGESATSASLSASSSDYPSVEEKAGTGILIFCATAEEARVMSHFLAAAGITAVVEFTTLATEAERRRALLQRPVGAGKEGSAADVSCVVASDALMRGIDIPNVGHVIMYHPPDAVSQYVHRAGRTARAMRPGHVHLLLSKTGPSGTQEDGEMALYKRLSQSLSRTLPVSYERLFFRFAENPSCTNTTPSTMTEKTVPPTGSAEWWVAQAGQFLLQSQHQLQRRWASVLESAAAMEAENAKKVSTVTGAKGDQEPMFSTPSASTFSTQASPPPSSSSSSSSSRKRARPDAAKTTAAH